jgi:hypothetical protein
LKRRKTVTLADCTVSLQAALSFNAFLADGSTLFFASNAVINLGACPYVSARIHNPQIVFSFQIRNEIGKNVVIVRNRLLPIFKPVTGLQNSNSILL